MLKDPCNMQLRSLRFDIATLVDSRWLLARQTWWDAARHAVTSHLSYLIIHIGMLAPQLHACVLEKAAVLTACNFNALWMTGLQNKEGWDDKIKFGAFLDAKMNCDLIIDYSWTILRNHACAGSEALTRRSRRWWMLWPICCMCICDLCDPINPHYCEIE